jgi:large subunit ribosomal protein L15
MQIHSLTRVHKNKKSIRGGRGGKRGKTSGRGTKGQLARSGHKLRPELRDIIKKIPKLRGRGRNFLKSTVAPTLAINLSVLEKHFDGGDVITKEAILSKKLGGVAVSKNWNVKILGDGEVTKKFNFKGLPLSASAKVKVEKVGGTIEA